MSSSKTIANQISTISGSLIAGLLLLSVLAISTTLFLRSTFLEYRGTARITLVAGAAFEDVFEAGMAALQWRLTAEEENVTAFRDNLTELIEAEAELKALTTGAPELTEKIEKFSADVEEYSVQFDAILDARAEYDGITSELRDTGFATREALSELMTTAFQDSDSTTVFYAGKAQQGLMLGRYYLERFRRTEAPRDFERAQSETQSALQDLETLKAELRNPARSAGAEEARALLTGFLDKTNGLVGAVEDQIAARGILDSLELRILSDIEELVDTVADRQNTLGPRGTALSFWSVVAICVAGIGVVLVGWRISKKMSGQITGGIEDAVTTISRIAEGDLDVEVRYTDQQNEIGQIARALEVFKSKGKAAIEAAKREKASEQARLKEAEEHKKEQDAQEAAARAQAEAARKAMISDLSKSLGNVVSAASKGDFSRRVDADFDDDELLSLAREVNALVASVESGIVATGHVLARVADGDLTEAMEGDFQGAFKDLQRNTNGMIDSLKLLVGDMSGTALNISASSTELRDTSDSLSRQAEQNAAALEETSAAVEELTASITQVSDNISDANSSARMASDVAVSSSTVAADAAEAMTRISDASKEIASVITVIDDISFQINLLALNAGVEAARAGEAGRGFAVVASEVRQLAQRAAEAAKEIDEVILRSDHAVSEGVAKVTGAQDSLKQISESVLGVSKSIEEISNAVSEQVNGVGEINNAVSQIDQNTQKQAASFEEVAAASGLLSSEADGLKQSVTRFNIGREVVALEPKPKAPVVSKLQTKTLPVTNGNLAVDLDGWDEF